jgi:phenylalanyl-tRNA synthetase beta chain
MPLSVLKEELITIAAYALKRAALLVQEVAGGDITSDLIDVYQKKIEDFSVFLNFGNVAKLSGKKYQKIRLNRF